MNMNEKQVIDLYTKEKKSTYDIAQILQTYPNKIRRILLKNGIELKNKSEAQKNALENGSAKIPTQGKQRTKEDRLKISSSMKKNWNNLSEEEYAKRVNVAKDRWNNMSDLEKQNMSSLAIKAIQVAGKEGSKLEKFLCQELTKAGFVVEFHKTNIIANQNLEIDMYIPRLRTIIEIDGPSHFLPIWGEKKLQKQIKADEHKTGLILSKGLIIIRIKNLLDNVSLADKENLKNNIIKILNSIDKNFPSPKDRFIELQI
jgi:very-short-patch-repair endonuclease